MLEIGSIVKYNPEYCLLDEQKYIHLVQEIGLINPVNNKPTRVKIITLNSNLTLSPVEVVEDYMLIEIGKQFN